GDKIATVFGPDYTPRFSYTDQVTNETFEFDGPPGLALEEETGVTSFVPVPMIQLGIGIVKNTDLKIRLIPTQETDDFSFKMFGIGVMHDVKQYIPGIKMLPFDLSVFVGYTDLDFELDLSDGSAASEGNVGTFDASALTIQGLISKK